MRLPVTDANDKPPVQVNSLEPVSPVKMTTQCQPTPKKSVAQLIGKRCMVSCALNGVPLQMLLDSGAQVTMVGRVWAEEALPNVKIEPLSSLFPDQPLEISAQMAQRFLLMDGLTLTYRYAVKAMDTLTYKCPYS